MHAPTGTTRKSWNASAASACSPPLMMFTIGSGRSPPPPRCRQSGIPCDAAAARATAVETARSGVRPEPRLVLAPVELDEKRVEPRLVERARAEALPGRSSRARSRPRRGRRCHRSAPGRRPGARVPRAGRSRLPTGTLERARVPSESSSSTSTVGRPPESRISRARTAEIVARHRSASATSASTASSESGGASSSRAPTFAAVSRSAGERYSAGDLPSTRATIRQPRCPST